ncbi:hypothetical protein ACLKA6_001815 [Drosophila palustris]
MARQLSECLDAACDSSMPRRKPSRRGSPCYWWNDQIAQLRKACLRARRCSQRARRRPDFEDRLEDLRAAKRALKRAIKASIAPLTSLPFASSQISLDADEQLVELQLSSVANISHQALWWWHDSRSATIPCNSTARTCSGSSLALGQVGHSGLPTVSVLVQVLPEASMAGKELS